ncbi:hypothetical protein [Massilia sp. NR 4-1]|uniref:hypothetical protein n=1 Tax=Massilia sp. NR 4-1 TaxID=1678028 RepID=UPI00067B9144|nr:hypothetical protein [Massilia sp. NR 4-1]AKU24136.1 hypothetical protein ACZ75_24480 [Massilia sp. NR 4-1]
MSSPFDSSIPVLTEVLRDTPPAAAESGSHAAPAHGTERATAPDTFSPAAFAPAGNAGSVPGGVIQHPASASSHSADPVVAQDTALDSLDAAGWEQLERRIAERILQQLQSRVDFVLEQRIKDSMAEVLNHALLGLTQEIRSGLQSTLNQVVGRAVAQELTHLQARKK